MLTTVKGVATTKDVHLQLTDELFTKTRAQQRALRKQVADIVADLDATIYNLKSTTIAVITFEMDGVKFEGVGVSKWSTDDQRTVQKARKQIDRLKKEMRLAPDPLDKWLCSDEIVELESTIRRLDYNEEKGDNLATYRARNDLREELLNAIEAGNVTL